MQASLPAFEIDVIASLYSRDFIARAEVQRPSLSLPGDQDQLLSFPSVLVGG